MKRQTIAALAACFLLGTALLAGCGEEEPIPSVTQETAVGDLDQTTPPDSRPTGSTEAASGDISPTEPEPTQAAPTEPAEPESECTEPTEPSQTAPENTDPTEPSQTAPENTEPTEPSQSEPENTEPTEPSQTETEDTTPTEPEQTESEKTEQTKPTQTPIPADVCSVDTPYGELHFQDRWSDYMQIRQEQEGDNLRVYFLARLDGEDYPLFDLTISPNPGTDGALQLTDHLGQKHSVEVNMEDGTEYTQLDAAGQEILYSMQEQVNFVIENLT